MRAVPETVDDTRVHSVAEDSASQQPIRPGGGREGGGMRAAMYVDCMGGGELEPADEYAEIEDMIRGVLGKDVSFERDVLPHKLREQRVDVYVFDFGGMLPGCDSLVESHFRSFIEQADEHPSTLFVVWSSFSGEMYKGFLTEEVGKTQHNVIIANGLTDEFENRLKELLS